MPPYRTTERYFRELLIAADSPEQAREKLELQVRKAERSLEENGLVYRSPSLIGEIQVEEDPGAEYQDIDLE
jgi:hypothetical protein